MFPPFPLLNKVIQKLHATQEGEVFLITPLVANTAVVPTPTSNVCGPLAVLPTFVVTTGAEVHLGWNTQMEALSCSIIKQQDFQETSLGLPQHLGDSQQIACMAASGFTSLTGPQFKVLIRLVPQLLK